MNVAATVAEAGSGGEGCSPGVCGWGEKAFTFAEKGRRWKG